MPWRYKKTTDKEKKNSLLNLRPIVWRREEQNDTEQNNAERNADEQNDTDKAPHETPADTSNDVSPDAPHEVSPEAPPEASSDAPDMFNGLCQIVADELGTWLKDNRPQLMAAIDHSRKKS